MRAVTEIMHAVHGLQHTTSALERRHEVPQLDGRKFPEALLDLPLRQLEENPPGRAPALPAHEVQPPAHRAGGDLGVRLHLDEHVPALVAALQFTHVLGAILAGEGGAHGYTMRCPARSCQLDSRCHELSRVRRPAGRAPPPSRRVAQRPAVGSRRDRGGSAVDRAGTAAGSREQGAGSGWAGGRSCSQLPAPDISQMSPEERATRLYNRVMSLHSEGKPDSAEFFLPMALQAYAMLPALDVDARYHIGVLDLTGGHAAAALAQADTIRRAVPTHLFAFMLRARALELERDPAGALRAYRDFLRNEKGERAKQRPEYAEHGQNLDAFHEQATEVTSGKTSGAPRQGR